MRLGIKWSRNVEDVTRSQFKLASMMAQKRKRNTKCEEGVCEYSSFHLAVNALRESLQSAVWETRDGVAVL